MIQTRKFLFKSGHRWKNSIKTLAKYVLCLKRVRAQTARGGVRHHENAPLAGPRRILPLPSLLCPLLQPASPNAHAGLFPLRWQTLVISLTLHINCKRREANTSECLLRTCPPREGQPWRPRAGCCMARPLSPGKSFSKHSPAANLVPFQGLTLQSNPEGRDVKCPALENSIQ